jgi:ribosome-associated protein
LTKTAPKTLAKRIIKIIWQKKAEEIVLLNLKGVSYITDYFVICSVASDIQARVVADAVSEDLKKKGVAFNVEGYQSPHWILIDCFSVVLHIFQPKAREFYSLEKFWGDAPREEYPDGL